MNTMKMKWCAMAVLAAAGQAHAVDKSWNISVNGNWNTGANWFAPGVPGFTDNVFIGNTAAATNTRVLLNLNATVASVSITDGMNLETASGRLAVAGLTSLSGSNSSGGVVYPSQIQVNDGPLVIDFQTDDLTMSAGAQLDMAGGTATILDEIAFPDSTSIYGVGLVNYMGSGAFRVDGNIYPRPGNLRLNQIGSGRFDLDGNVSNGRYIAASTYRADGTAFASLTVTGDQLADTFDERLRIMGGCEIDIQMSNGWAMGTASAIEFTPNPAFPGPATLAGTALSFGGTIILPGAASQGTILAPITLLPTAFVDVNGGDRLDFDAATTINGGTFTSDATGRLHFDGPTTITGGTFSCGFSVSGQSASVQFNGATSWNGSVSINGVATQDGNAHVTGPTTITGDVFDLDGFSGGSAWTIDHPLVLNLDALDNQGYNSFDGVMTLAPGLNISLTVNLNQPATHWLMDGSMNVSTVGNLHITKVSGTPVRITGDLNLTGAPRFTANTWLAGTSSTTFTTPTSSLRLGGVSRVSGGATFAGGGTVIGLAGGTLTLEDGAGLGTTSVTAEGGFSVGDGVGGASVHRYVQNAGATWTVQIGGNAPGTTHDQLIASGAGASINGNVEVELMASGGGTFIPAVGQTFLILNTIHGVTGTFADPPVTNANGVKVNWSFVYTGNNVLLRADSVEITCPADFNGDGFLDFFDYDDYVNCFETGVCPAGKNADYNLDGFVDFFDYDDFVQAFENGC